MTRREGPIKSYCQGDEKLILDVSQYDCGASAWEPCVNECLEDKDFQHSDRKVTESVIFGNRHFQQLYPPEFDHRQ